MLFKSAIVVVRPFGNELRHLAKQAAPAIAIALLMSIAGLSTPAAAATCPAYTYTFSNGTTADATQVNTNFSDIRTCANTLLAPITDPSFLNSLTAQGTITDATDGDTAVLAKFQVTIHPTADSGTNSAAILAVPTYDTAFNFYETGPNAPTSAIFQNLLVNAGTIADISSAQFWGMWLGGDAATLGTVSSVQAAMFSPIVSFSNSLTTTVTKAVGVHVLDSQKNTLQVTGQAGIQIEPLAAATNNTALLIGQATVPTGSFGIYNASASNNYLNGSVGIGMSSPAQKLEVNGKIKIDSFGSATSATVCQLSGVLSSCSSSIRYKENVVPADFGLREVSALRPVTFKWRGRAEKDFGFIAEEAAKVNPLFATYKDGKIEGVKYPQLTAVLVGAIKQQQKIIAALQAANDRQAQEILALQVRMVRVERKLTVRTAQN